MTGPQLENGYTRIANELLDAIIATDLTKREMKILLAVIRKTYGYGKKSDDMTISQISYMTGIGRPNASRAFHGLITRRVLNSSPGVFGYEVSINKKYWEWDDRIKAVPRREIMERDGWSCRECGRETPIEKSGLFVDSAPEIDHIVEVSAGGTDDASNLQLLCRKCHQAKTKSYLKGHTTVSVGIHHRVGRDTSTDESPCRKGHAARVERDTQRVSVGTHTKDNSKRQLQKSVRASSWPEGESVPLEWIEEAERKYRNSTDWSVEAERFVAKHTAKGSTFKNWKQAWWSWCSNPYPKAQKPQPRRTAV